MDQLKRLRVEKGLSQARLAARAGVDPSTVNQIERGAREASPATLRKLSEALDVSLVDLLEEANSPKAGRRSSLEPSFNDLLEEERRLLAQNVPESFEELLEAAEAHSRWAAMPDMAWREAIEGADAEEARRIYTELEAERQATFLLRRVMFAQDDEGPRNLATRLTGRFMVRGSQAALRTRDLALIEEAELAAAEALTAT